MTTTARTVDYTPRTNWTEVEVHNVERVAEFIHLAMNAHDYEGLRSRFGGSSYIQHSRGIPDGLDGIVDYLGSLTRRFPEYGYDVKQVYVDGDYVTFHSHATLRAKYRGNEKKGFNIIDTWRVEEGRLVEHWDAIQPLGMSMRLLVLLTGGRTAHTNGLF
ncbi:MAG: nuclear transport factor 2 family protein [Actinomycetota bacterium]